MQSQLLSWFSSNQLHLGQKWEILHYHCPNKEKIQPLPTGKSDIIDKAFTSGFEIIVTHINDNTNPHGSLLRQLTLAINDYVSLMADSAGLRLVSFSAPPALTNLKLQNMDIRGTLDIADNIVTVNSQVTGAPSTSAGIEVQRGTSTNVNLLWDETNDYWSISDDTSLHYRVLDQRDRDELDTEDAAIRAYVTANYVHRTGSVNEAISGTKTFSNDTTFSTNISVGGNAVITGNLTVNGTTTSINTTELDVSDNIINLNNDVTGTPTENSGINIVRGTSSDVGILWDETHDYWELTDDGSNWYKIADQRDVDALNQSITNLENDVDTNYVHRTGSVNEAISGTKTFSNNIVVNGSSTLEGVVNVGDSKVTVNYGGSATDALFQVDRGASPDTALKWDESTDTWMLTQDGSNYYRIITTNDEGPGNGFDADTVDGYDAADFVNGTVGAIQHTSVIHAGWYTIAVNSGDRASAKILITDGTSGQHQALHIYAGVQFGSSANITILSNTVYNSGVCSIDSLRIKTGGTYDGALLQVHITTDLNALQVALSENLSISGWLLKDFVPDGVNPGDVGNFAGLTSVTSQINGIDVDEHTVFSNNIYAGTGGTAHYKVWHAGNDGNTSGLDADLVRGLASSASDTPSTVVTRDSDANITARQFRSTWPEQTSAPATTADIAFRVNSSVDNYVRFMSSGAFSSWCQSSLITTHNSLRLNNLLLHAGRNNEANKVVRTDSSGYLNTGWVNTTSGDAGTTTISRVYASNDGFIRYYTLAHFADQVLSQGSTTNAHTHSYITVSDTRSVNGGPNTYDRVLRGEFKNRSTVNSPGTTGTYCGVVTFAPWIETSGGNAYQIAFTMENGMSLRTGDLNASSWGSWVKVWHSGNDGFNSGLDADILRGAPPSTIGTASTIVQRNSAGDIMTRLFRSTYGEQTTAPPTTSDIAFRINSTSDNYIRFMSNAGFSSWCQNASIKVYDSQRLSGLLLHTGVNNVANRVVRTDGSGNLQTGWISTTSGDAGNTGITRVYASNDGWLRYYTLSNFAAQVLVQGSWKNAHVHSSTELKHYSGSSSFSGVAVNSYKTVSLPSGIPSTYHVAITATNANPGGTLGDVYVGKASTYINVGRTGSYTGSFDYIITWN